jgi:toxin ParE1/3/4
MIVRFSPVAAQDLEEIGDYLDARNPSAAYRFVRDLRGRCGKLADMPLRGVARPEFGETVRSFAFRRYVVFYSVSEQDIRIERILHGARDIRAVLDI